MPCCNRRRLLLLTVVLAGAGALTHPRRAGAASVPYAGSVSVNDLSHVTWETATVLAQRAVPFLLLDASFDAAYDLTLDNYVLRVGDAGTLDFAYRVTNASDRPLRLIDVDTGRFTRPDSFDPIDVNLFDEAAGSYAPIAADRGRSHFGGVALDFPPSETLAPGESSQLFIIRTAATRYEMTGLTQFRATPGTTTNNGFALTFNPVMDGPLVPPPGIQTAVPLPPGMWSGPLMALLIAGVHLRGRGDRAKTANQRRSKKRGCSSRG